MWNNIVNETICAARIFLDGLLFSFGFWIAYRIIFKFHPIIRYRDNEDK